MSDVVQVYRLHESGQMALLLGPDPPHLLLSAVNHFHSVLGRVRDELQERRRKQRDAERRVRNG